MSNRSRTKRRRSSGSGGGSKNADDFGDLHIRNVGFRGYERASARHDRHRRALMAADRISAGESSAPRLGALPLGKGGARGPGSTSDIGLSLPEGEEPEGYVPTRRCRVAGRRAAPLAARGSAAERKRKGNLAADKKGSMTNTCRLERGASTSLQSQAPKTELHATKDRQVSIGEGHSAQAGSKTTTSVEGMYLDSTEIPASPKNMPLEASLSCVICRSLLIEPITSLCPYQHTFCSSCLRRYLTSAGAKIKRMSVGSASTGKSLIEVTGMVCPGERCEKEAKEGSTGGDGGDVSFIAVLNHVLGRVINAYKASACYSSNKRQKRGL